MDKHGIALILINALCSKNVKLFLCSVVQYFNELFNVDASGCCINIIDASGFHGMKSLLHTITRALYKTIYLIT